MHLIYFILVKKRLANDCILHIRVYKLSLYNKFNVFSIVSFRNTRVIPTCHNLLLISNDSFSLEKFLNLVSNNLIITLNNNSISFFPGVPF